MANSDVSNMSPEEIRGRIEQTQSDMNATIDALQVKLDPQRIKRQATGAVRDATVGRLEDMTENASDAVKGASADVLDTIKKNPLPAALAAVGLGWLFMESRNTGRMRPAQRYYQTPTYRGNEGDYLRDASYTSQQGGQYQQTSARDKASQMTDQAQAKAGQMADQAQAKASELADRTQQKASELADQAQQRASYMADQAQQQMQVARSNFEDFYNQNPLLVGAAAVALGAAIGMSIPQTQVENQFLGQARDTVVDKVQDTAHDTLNKAQDVAQKAADAAQDTAKREAQKQNLTSS